MSLTLHFLFRLLLYDQNHLHLWLVIWYGLIINVHCLSFFRSFFSAFSMYIINSTLLRPFPCGRPIFVLKIVAFSFTLFTFTISFVF